MTNPMMAHDDGKWTQHNILFNDGSFSVVSGLFQEKHHLGERWNVSERRQFGFPISESGRPAWHVVPDFLELPLLYALLQEVIKNPRGQVETALNDKDVQEKILDEIRSRSKRLVAP